MVSGLTAALRSRQLTASRSRGKSFPGQVGSCRRAPPRRESFPARRGDAMRKGRTVFSVVGLFLNLGLLAANQAPVQSQQAQGDEAAFQSAGAYITYTEK